MGSPLPQLAGLFPLMIPLPEVRSGCRGWLYSYPNGQMTEWPNPDVFSKRSIRNVNSLRISPLSLVNSCELLELSRHGPPMVFLSPHEFGPATPILQISQLVNRRGRKSRWH